MSNDVIIIDESKIIAVDERGIICKDDTGNDLTIIFEVCHQHFYETQSQPENIEKLPSRITHEDYLKHLKNYPLIADRNSLGDWKLGDKSPYIEFYASPPIRIRFKDSNSLFKLITGIMKYGWITSDLT